MPLLEGLDGVQKMSKSLSNYIGITEHPENMFGKIMSISDELMWRYFELLSFRSNEDIDQLKSEVEGGRNPRDVKFLLCEEIIERFHDSEAAKAARESFISRFQKGAMPEDIPEKALDTAGEGIGIAAALSQCKLTSSNSEAFRMIKQGAVKLDGEKVEDKGLNLDKGQVLVAQVGKRKFARITLT